MKGGYGKNGPDDGAANGDELFTGGDVRAMLEGGAGPWLEWEDCWPLLWWWVGDGGPSTSPLPSIGNRLTASCDLPGVGENYQGDVDLLLVYGTPPKYSVVTCAVPRSLRTLPALPRGRRRGDA